MDKSSEPIDGNKQTDDDFLECQPSIHRTDGSGDALFLQPDEIIVIGTDKTCQISLPFGRKIFPRHASIEWTNNIKTIRKLFEPASVIVNSLQIDKEQNLLDGDSIILGEIAFYFKDPSTRKDGASFQECIEIPMEIEKKSVERHTKKLTQGISEHILNKSTTTIGRDPSNTIVLPHEMVSRFHSKIDYLNNNFYIFDLGSTNGTFLNGEHIMNSILSPEDLIQIGDFEFMFDGRSLKQSSHEGEARIDVFNLKRKLPNGSLILNDICFSIYPRELVAIVGGSGAGKSTLMNALGGFSPADSGTVLVNRRNFYKYFNAFRSTLGYVPQDDIIHKELSVYRALYYAAYLRMPEDLLDSEREDRIIKVMEELHLSHRKNTSITQLSGGERKRVSIGVELLTRPRLFFLDEPTSGLDPSLEGDMMHIFRKLANQGHTTTLITHATKNLHLCDRVIFLARGGYLAFFGSPQEALRYFEAEDFTEIYMMLERKHKPEIWGEMFRKSPEYISYVDERLNDADPAIKTEDEKSDVSKQRKKRSIVFGINSAFRQFIIQSLRYTEIIVRDAKNLAILLMQAPVIGVLLSFVYGSDIFDKSTGSYPEAKSLLFFLICICIWFGTSNSAREISKEIPIYRRERFINLGIAPYILSKVAVLFVLGLIQTAMLLGIICIKVIIPDCGIFTIYDVFLTMLLTSTCAMTMGLMVSAIVNNPDKSASLVPILLIPQIVFSGGIIKLEGIADLVSYLTLSRWGFELLGYITKVSYAPLVTTPSIKRTTEGIFDIIPSTHWHILVGYLVLFILIACLFQKMKDHQRTR